MEKSNKTIPGASGLTVNTDNGGGMVYFMVPLHGTDTTVLMQHFKSMGGFDTAARCAVWT